MTKSDYLNLWIHQNQLVWNRLQTVGVIELATLSGGYSLIKYDSLYNAIMIIGTFFVLLVFNLSIRDIKYREKINEKIKDDFSLDIKSSWYAPLKGTSIMVLFYFIIIVINIFCLFFLDSVISI